MRRSLAIVLSAGLLAAGLAAPASADRPHEDRFTILGRMVFCENGPLMMVDEVGTLVYRGHRHEKRDGTARIHGVIKFDNIRAISVGFGEDGTMYKTGTTYKVVGTGQFRGVESAAGEAYSSRLKANVIGPHGKVGRIVIEGGYRGTLETSLGSCHMSD